MTVQAYPQPKGGGQRNFSITAALVLGSLLLPQQAIGDPLYKAYRQEVDCETAATFLANRDQLDPLRTRGRRHGIDLDHIKSVKQCWLEGLAPKDCAALDNLRLMDAKLNRAESCRQACGRGK
jgi:hypothetical protein